MIGTPTMTAEQLAAWEIAAANGTLFGGTASANYRPRASTRRPDGYTPPVPTGHRETRDAAQRPTPRHGTVAMWLAACPCGECADAGARYVAAGGQNGPAA